MFFSEKKCRIYATCGVSQTPNILLESEVNIMANFIVQFPLKTEMYQEDMLNKRFEIAVCKAFLFAEIQTPRPSSFSAKSG